MTNILYLILIYPLESIITYIYNYGFFLCGNIGISIIGVSLAVNLLCLPLYAVAERWQGIERDTQKRMKPKIDDIKAVFRGDERQLILSTYYRQNHYHPVYALRSSFGLLIQVPFFIAAYNVLSHLPSLIGATFIGIPDLSRPDRLLTIAGFSVNVLPLLMTAINVVASAIYTKGFGAKEKVQLYVMSALFLILLYDSPSGLVFYWTLNNVFSLLKNAVYKTKNPVKTGWFLAIAALVVLLFLFLTVLRSTPLKIVFLIGAIVFLIFLPKILDLKKKFPAVFRQSFQIEPKQQDQLFVISCLALTLIVGLVVPSTLIASSPQEFSMTREFYSPLTLLYSTVMQAFGFLFVWPLCLYLLFSRKVKRVFCYVFSLSIFWCLIDLYIFRGNYGAVSSYLTFETPGVLVATPLISALNLLALLAVTAAFFAIIYRKKTKLLISVASILVVSFIAMSSYNAIQISRKFDALKLIVEDEKRNDRNVGPVYHLSKGKKNVLIIMLDRAIGSFPPYVLQDDKSVASAFDGFTWYSNTVSFGGHTVFGSPPIFGGYDYTPDEMIRKNDKTLVQRHNEALTALPRLFAENKWSVTATDLPFANYSWLPDNSIFKQWPAVHASNLQGEYLLKWRQEHPTDNANSRGEPSYRVMRSLLPFCAMKAVPAPLRLRVYGINQLGFSDTGSAESMDNFLRQYSTLDYLPRVTDFNASESNLILMDNETTHQKYPYEVPLQSCDLSRFDDPETKDMYQVNVLAYQALARFFQRMKEENVWDNTRIILVSDHGIGKVSYADHSKFPNSIGKANLEPGYYNPLLMVKDFGATGALKEDMSFMTNGDVPDIATRGLMNNPVNPWTGKPFAAGERKNSVHITTSARFNPADHGKMAFTIADSEFIRVHDNIFDPANWETSK